MKNFDQHELEKFTQLASQWWDPNGKFKPLHLINPLRSEYIDSKIPVSGKTILDVGCGGGILSESLARKGAKVTGIDLSDGPLKVAKIRNDKVNLDITYKKISTGELFFLKNETIVSLVKKLLKFQLN